MKEPEIIEGLIHELKREIRQHHCHHHWIMHVGVRFMGHPSYSFLECDKCGKKVVYKS